MTDELRTYYERPVLQAGSWKFWIPTYFFLSGLAAGSSLLAAGADAIGDARLARVARATALGAISAGAGALVADLGRPERFHHMLRVVRPSSPLNVGSWLLAAYGPLAGLAAVTGRRTPTWAAAALAPAVATYTGVVVADTAIPAWHDAARTMPGVFAAGAAASAGGLAMAFVPDSAPARRLAVRAAACEVALTTAQHRGVRPDVSAAYTQGPAGALHYASTALLVAGAVMTAVSKRRLARRLGGLSITLGAAAERFAITEAGRASAADPRATIGPQRARMGARANAGIPGPTEGLRPS